MSEYIYQQANWPHLTWDTMALAASLAGVRHRQGVLLGRMESLGFLLRQEAVLETLTQDVLQSSEIEGEQLNTEQVRSSLARRLGMESAAALPADRAVEGVVEMMLDATQNFAAALTQERLFGWHASLFPSGWSGLTRIQTGCWRDDSQGPMQVVSGPIGREKVHYEAPPASQIAREMATFLRWFSQDDPSIDPVLKAGVAHLWFVTIHPFDDGNGRIARAIADMALARSEGTAQRFYSLSAQIRRQRSGYYEILERSQKGSLDITPWLSWFLLCLSQAFTETEETLARVLYKARFWETHRQASLNTRQRLLLNRLLNGFEGKLTSSKWAKIAACSQDTALRDILALVEQGILLKNPGGGRSVSYDLAPLTSRL